MDVTNELNTNGAPRQRLMPKGHWDWHVPTPFSQGWRVGSLVFVGGQLALDEKGELYLPLLPACHPP